MRFEIGFGNASQIVDIPKSNILDVLYPNEIILKDISQEDIVKHSLDYPIGSQPLEDIVKGKQNIVIVTSDITRPMPSHIVLPVLLGKLYQFGISANQITIIFALGSHREHTEDEKKHVVGEEIYAQIRCFDSSEFDFIHMGTTSQNTPVDICRAVAEADVRICLGNIEYHYFAGYSGGAKAIMPGVSTKAAIQANHSHMTDKRACAGHLEDNPLRQDLEEAVTMCPVDFILNVILNEHKHIIHAVCGHIALAHREGCRFLDQIYLKPIQQKADIVLVSQGGAPKDLNLYQTQKALENAKYAVKDGGIIILIGSCKEGMGEKTFEEWMVNAPSTNSLIERIQADFQLGGHKAAAIAMVLQYAQIYLVSDMPDEFVNSIFLKPFHSVQSALQTAFEELGARASVFVMPFGGSTLPVLKPSDPS